MGGKIQRQGLNRTKRKGGRNIEKGEEKRNQWKGCQADQEAHSVWVGLKEGLVSPTGVVCR